MEKQIYQNQEQDRSIKELRDENKELRKLVNNHITDNTKAMNAFRIEVTEIKTDVSWLKKNYWVIATASAGAFFAAIANLIIR